jgi:SAM-dependent methyltransferase
MLTNYQPSMLRLRAATAMEGARIVEVGTGWMPVVPLLFSVAGAASVYTCDHLRLVTWPEWRSVVDALWHEFDTMAWMGWETSSARERLAAIRAASSLDDALQVARIRYDAPADATALPLGDGTADVHYSYSVVENMPVPVVHASLAEARRVLAPGGWLSMVVGCSDPCRSFDPRLSRVNYLRYPDWYWNALTTNRFSFNNRMREPEFLGAIVAAGGTVLSVASSVHRPDIERVRGMNLPERFARFHADELAVHKSEILARFGGPPGAGAPARETSWVEAP